MAPDRPMRILLADDEPDILMLLEAMLAGRPWHIVGAADGREALELAAETPPDVAVLDYMMPGMHGMELADRLKALHPDCTIVLFSAYKAGEATATDAIDHYLPKTEVADLEDLLEQIAVTKSFQL